MRGKDFDRTEARKDVILQVDYDNAEDFVIDFTVNASSTGVFIATERPIDVGEQVDFRVSFPGLMPPLRCRGIVRWRRTPPQISPARPGGVGVEVQFENLEEAERYRCLIVPLAACQAAAPDPTLAGPRVLVAMGSQQGVFLSAVRAYSHLGRQPIEVVDAVTAERAWELLLSSKVSIPFELAIVDVGIGPQGGLELIDRVRREEPELSLALPVIAVGKREMQEHALLAGADLYLAQPVGIDVLFEALNRYLRLDPSA